MTMTLRICEFVVLAWCAVAVVVGLTRALPASNRVRLLGGASLLAGATMLCGLLPLDGVAGVVRNLVPALFVLAAYRVSAAFFVAPQVDVEAWLASTDRQLLPWLARPWPASRVSRWALEALEVSYFGVYLVLPLGAWAAHAHGSDNAVDRYWTLVFLAEASSYLALAWVQTRPPRAFAPHAALWSGASCIRRVNDLVLRHGSIQVNTLPSGHAAGAVAVALALSWQQVPAAPVFSVIATLICIATVVGRYHYVVDTVAGAVVALAWWALLRLAWVK